jgi:hypothetical protein
MNDLFNQLTSLVNDMQYHENALRPLLEKRAQLMETLTVKLNEKLQNGTFKFSGRFVHLKLDWATVLKVNVSTFRDNLTVTSIEVIRTESVENVLLPEPAAENVEIGEDGLSF